MASPQELDRMRRDAELLISTVAKTGRAPPPQETAAASPPAAMSAAKPAPEPVLGAPQHSTKNRKLTAEEQLFALAGEGERPASSSEGLFAKVAQMAQAAEEAAPPPAQVVDRPPQPAPVVAHHKRVDTPTLPGPSKQGGSDGKKEKNEAQRALSKGKKGAKPPLTRVDTPLPATLSNAAASALAHHAHPNEDPAAREEERMLRAINKHSRTHSHENLGSTLESQLEHRSASANGATTSVSGASSGDAQSGSAEASAHASVSASSSHSVLSATPTATVDAEVSAYPHGDAGAPVPTATPTNVPPTPPPTSSLPAVVLEGETVTVVPSTPPRASVDPFSLSAAETAKQKEEVERNQALIYEMLGGKTDADVGANTPPYEEPRSPAALLADLTASIADEEKKAKEKADADAVSAAAARTHLQPPLLLRQDTPLPGVIKRLSADAKRNMEAAEAEEADRLEEDKEKNLPPVHSRPGEGLRARPPSDTVSPRVLPNKKEDHREEKLRSMMEAAKKKGEEKANAGGRVSPAPSETVPDTGLSAVAPSSPPTAAPAAVTKSDDTTQAQAPVAALPAIQVVPVDVEPKQGSETDLDALLSDDMAAQRAREAREMASIEEEEKRMKELEDALAAQEAEHDADVQARRRSQEAKAKEEIDKEKEKEVERKRKEKEDAELAASTTNSTTNISTQPPAAAGTAAVVKTDERKATDVEEDANEAIAELDDLLNRAEAQQKDLSSVGSNVGRDKESITAVSSATANGSVNGIGNGKAQEGSDELYEVETPGDVAEETGPREESADAIEELLNARAVVAEFQVVTAPGPVADAREPDTRTQFAFKSKSPASSPVKGDVNGSDDGDDITELEPPAGDEIDEISEAELWTSSGVVRKAKEQVSSIPASAMPKTITPPQIAHGQDTAMKSMRMRVKKIFDLFVPSGEDSLSGSSLEDFVDQIATHFNDEVGDDAIEFGPHLDAEGALTFDGFLAWWKERQASRSS